MIHRMYLFDESKKIAPRAEFEDKPHVVPCLVPVVELEHVRAAQAVDHL